MKAAVAISFLVLTAVACGSVRAQSARDVVGVWEPVKNVNTSPDGKVSQSFGDNPKGITIFTEDGHFIIFNIKDQIPKIAANNRNEATPEENKAIMAGSLALYGTFAITGKKVILNVDQSTYPNWSGTQQSRDIGMNSPDEMTWTLSSSRGGETQATYRRMKR